MIAKLVYKHLQSSEEAKKLHIMVFIYINSMKLYFLYFLNIFIFFFYTIKRILFQLFKNNGLLLVNSGQIYWKKVYLI